jgi:hypothetical protein
MEMIFNHMPAEYYADRNISFLSKLVLERIWSLSKNGTQEVFFNRQVYATFFGANPSSMSKCFKELIDNGYLREVKNKNPFDRTKKFCVIEKQLTVEKSNKDVEKSNSDITLDSWEKQYSDCWQSERSAFDYHDNVHQTDHISKEKYRSESVDHTHTLSLDFDSIFSAMNEVKNEISDHIFTDAEIRENAQSYLDKSQLYNAYKGKPTEAKLKAWLKNSIRFQQEKPKTNKTAEHKMDWEEVAERLPERLQRIRELEEKYDREYSELVEADYQIIDELEDKNASA